RRWAAAAGPPPGRGSVWSRAGADGRGWMMTLAQEAKSIVAFAFRNGPIETIHADSRISDDEMRALMKFAVDHVYHLLALRERDHERYKLGVEAYARAYCQAWDEPTGLRRPEAPAAPPEAGRDGETRSNRR